MERGGRLFGGCLFLTFAHFLIVYRESWRGGFYLAYCMPVCSFSSRYYYRPPPLSMDFVSGFDLPARSPIHPINQPLPVYYGTVLGGGGRGRKEWQVLTTLFILSSHYRGLLKKST